MIPCDTHMIPVYSENQNNTENMRNKRYKIVGNTPKRLINRLIIREMWLHNAFCINCGKTSFRPESTYGKTKLES